MITLAEAQNSVSGSRLLASLIPSLKNGLYGQMKIKWRLSPHRREWWTPKTCSRRKALMFWTWQSGAAFRQVWLGLLFYRILNNCKVTWNFAKHSDVRYWIATWCCKCGLTADGVPSHFGRNVRVTSIRNFLCGWVTVCQLTGPQHLPILHLAIPPGTV